MALHTIMLHWDCKKSDYITENKRIGIQETHVG